MSNFWKLVNKVIMGSDLLLEILDARMVDDSRNKEIETKVKESGKPLIFVINKCDLVDKARLEELKKSLKPSVFVSATEHLGTKMLRQEIMKHAPPGRFKVGVLGYPNTGKSSIINALKGQAAAPTSPVSGFTKSIRLFRINSRMYLVDSPGVFPYKEADEAKHAMISARSVANIKNPELAALDIIERYPKEIEKYYGIKHDEDSEVTLENIALKIKTLGKGGKPDTHNAALMLIRDVQKNNIKIVR